MGNQATYGIAIVADDKTAKGAKSAEKRLGQIPKHYGTVSRKALEESDKAAAKSGRGILGTFSSVERAGAKIFGGKSITSGITSRLGAVRSAAAAAGEGMGEAATAGSALEGAIGAVGVVAGATVGIIAAAGYAAFKLADGWAKGAASIGRTADTIGVATKALQEFQAAGERAGVDRGASTSALGGIAQTLNDARYGRNNEALALMMRLGLKFKQGADGQLDTAGMTLDLADAISRQKNAQTRRLIAGKFGIGDAALPMFLQGSAPLRADMADADVHAGVLSDDDVRRGRSIVRKGAIVSQMKDRAMMRAGSFTAQGEETVYDGIISGGHAIMDGGTTFDHSVRNDFVPAARTMDRAASRMERASYAGTGGGIMAQAQRGARLRDKLLASGFSRPDADALAANAIRESGGDYTRNEILKNGKRGPGYGLWQWTDKTRKNNFQRVFGHSIYNSTEDEQIAFLRWELGHSEAKGWAAAHAAGADPGSIGRGFALQVERMKDKGAEPLARGDVAAALDKIPVHVTIDMKGAPHGTRATVKAGRSARPAISHAFAFEPVHGG
jgi:hypothetical protein